MNSLRDRKAINISKEYHEDYINLKKSSETEYSVAPFNDFRELYLLAAATGVLNNAFKPITSKKEKIFDSNVFNEYTDLPVLFAIAYQHEKDALKLADDEYILNIVEGYANGGLPLLKQEVLENPNTNLLNLALYIEKINS